MKKNVWKIAGAVSLTACLFQMPAANAIDLDPGDYESAPAGVSVGLLYYQHATRNKAYAGGNVALRNAQFDSDVGIARFVHYMKLGDYLIAPQVLLPFGQLRAGGNLSALGSNSGLGDVILAAPLWLINNPEQRNFFAVTPYLFAPTGNYDRNRALNLGENRWKFNLQAGYVTAISKSWSFDLSGDVMVFGKNSDLAAPGARLEQDPLYQVQGYLKYHWTDATRLAAGLSHSFGGETQVNGVAQNDRAKTTKVMLNWSTFVDQKNALMVGIGKDLRVENGLQENARVNLRYLHIF
jgi:hypothetical protein